MAYIHDLNPFAIQFTETFGIRWYGLAYLAGFVAGYLTMDFMAKRGTIQLTRDKVGDYITAVAIGTLVGGRLGYCLFYAPELWTQFSSQFPYWGVLEVHKGGMASHGGLLGVMAAGAYFGRKYKISILHLIDITVFGAALGIFFGRIANFINGELYGRACAETYRWAVKFPQEMFRWFIEERERLKTIGPVAQALGPIDMGGATITVTPDLWNTWLSQNNTNSNLDYVIELIIRAVQKGNQQVIELLGPLLTPRYPSQLFQGLMEGLGVFIVLSLIWLKPRKPGVIAGWFGITYTIARIIGEQYRLPDVQIGYELFGLTRGQWLSIAFLVIALVYIAVAQRRDVDRIGGWGIDQETKLKNIK